MSETRITKKYLLIYTLAFLALGFLVFLPFLRAGKSLVGNGDGVSQYILQLRYTGDWLREAFSDLLHGHLNLRSYDFTIGPGDDINAIVRFHPLDFLAFFVPAACTEVLYVFLIFLRLYLAGLSFSAFAFYWKRTGACTLAGCMVYLFCGYVFELAIVHPIYAAPMIVMPLLLLGAEYMMLGLHSFALFSAMVWLGFVSNYYFMYINSVGLLIYVLVRFPAVFRRDRVRSFLRLFIRMVSAYLVGLFLSAVTLLPAIRRYLGSYRSENLASVSNLLFYEDKRRYGAWLVNLISPLEASGNGTHLNFAVIVLPCLVLLFLGARRTLTGLKRLALITLLFLLLPAGGFVMAVFHNENNRWVYLISLLLGMVTAFTADSFRSLSPLQKKGLLAAAAAYDAGIAALSFIEGLNPYHLLAAAELTAATVLLLSAGRKKGARRDRRCVGMVLAVTFVSTVLNGYFTFGSRFGNLTRYYADAGSLEEYYGESVYANYGVARALMAGEEGSGPDHSPADVWKDGFYRVDGLWNGSNEDNASVQLGYPGCQIYNSVLNASLISWLLQTDNIGLTTMLHIHGLDGRSASEAFMGTRYYQCALSESRSLPFGFGPEPVWSDGKMGIYENRLPLSFAFAVDQVLPLSSWEQLDGAQAEEAMLHAAVLEDGEAVKALEGGLKEYDPSQDSGRFLYEEIPLPEGNEDVKRTDSGYRTKKKKAEISFSCERRPGYDILLELKGLVPKDMGTSVRILGDGIDKKVTLLSEEQTYTLLREDYLVSLGYEDGRSAGQETLSLRFAEKGQYDLEQMRIIYVLRDPQAAGLSDAGFGVNNPMGRNPQAAGLSDASSGQESFAERIGALNSCVLEDLQFGKDTVTGNMNTDRACCIVFQIPFSTGWTASVNGQKAPLLRADAGFMGLCVEAGSNAVRLSYTTPGSRSGRYLSLLGLLLFAAGLIGCSYGQKRKPAAGEKEIM